MPSGAVAYKQPTAAHAENLDRDDPLWDYVRLATSLVERTDAPAAYESSSAVVVRPPDGDPVVIVVVDRQVGVLPAAADLAGRFGLTRRESEVALLLADRLSCREVARRLGVSFSTARCHTEHILVKLRVSSKQDVRSLLLAAKPTISRAAWLNPGRIQ